MRNVLSLLFFILLTSINVFAASSDNYYCTLIDGENEFKVVFDDRRYNDDKELVEIYKNNKIISAYIVNKKVDPNSHGDGWSFILSDSKNNNFELFMYAQYLQSAYLTIPSLGFDKLNVESCSPKLAD